MKIRMRKYFSLFIFYNFIVACNQSEITALGEIVSQEPSQEREAEDGDSKKSQSGLLQDSRRIILNGNLTVRTLRGNVLVKVADLPAGTQIEIPLNYETKFLDFLDSSGNVQRSSSGFIYGLKIISVSSELERQITRDQIDRLNSEVGGLYASTSIISSLEGIAGNFLPLEMRPAKDGYRAHYEESGKPRFNSTNAIVRRFGSRLNLRVEEGALDPKQFKKWREIYQEIIRAVDRTKTSAKSFMMIERQLALSRSLEFEKTGLISPMGAWTIATQATAVRHGFGNVPCAEFQSEILRQAYQRAGYRVTEDFNQKKGNPLIWSHTAAVVNFSSALFKAGWIPWDASVYRPPVGAFLMHGAGNSPGHTYIAAGGNGRFIVDNGAPQGRDLSQTDQKIIALMFRMGVFFLPPGIYPQPWKE